MASELKNGPNLGANGTAVLSAATNLEAIYPGDVFARGYYFADGEPVFVPPTWRRVPLFGRVLFHDARLPVHQASSGPASVACLGIIVDVHYPLITDEDVVRRLADNLNRSETAFQEAVSWTNGRYVLLYRTDDRHVKVQTDATGMRPAFYFRGRPGSAVGSHAALLAANAGEACVVSTVTHKWGFPGRMTPYRDVLILTPNTRLILPNLRIERYFPISELPRQDVSEIVEPCRDILLKSRDAFCSRYRLVMSLTAGLDSRTVLSILKDRCDEVLFVTYYRNERDSTDLVDLSVAASLADTFGLEHRVIHLTGEPIPCDFRTLCETNAHYSHIDELNEHWAKHYAGQGLVHLRSNIAEIGRVFYAAHCQGETLDSSALVKCYGAAKLKRVIATNVDLRAFLVAAKQDYMEATGLAHAARFVDYRDLFYWEHRMGCWHSQVVSGTDPTFETLSLFNCRQLLELFLRPSFESRRSGQVFSAIIARSWPELMDFPLNPHALDDAAAASARARLFVNGYV
jgi:hypothetical protein